jgi:hypothetical protein
MQLAHHPSQRGLRRGSLPCLYYGKRRQELTPVAQPCTRRGDRANVFIERDQSGGITLANQHKRDGGNQTLRVRDLGEH